MVAAPVATGVVVSDFLRGSLTAGLDDTTTRNWAQLIHYYSPCLSLHWSLPPPQHNDPVYSGGYS